jgi:HNH endonuclease/AP2 domain
LKLIPLTKGKTAIVDDEDYEFLNRWKWKTHAVGNKFYATRTGGTKGTYRMHRVIMGLTKGDPIEVDHINGNSLDNRRRNLRLATHAQNGRNLQMKSSNTSGYKGVTFHKFSGLWHAVITVDRRTVSLGYYHDPKEAHAAYCAAATLHHGEFARFQ